MKQLVTVAKVEQHLSTHPSQPGNCWLLRLLKLLSKLSGVQRWSSQQYLIFALQTFLVPLQFSRLSLLSIHHITT